MRKKIPVLIGTILTLSLAALSTARAEEEESRFKIGELEVSPFGTYVDKEGGKWGLGASATYFVTDKLGVGASTYWADFQGSFFDNVAGEAYFRLPILKVIAPYAVGSVGYEFETEEWFETLGLGVDFRAFKNLSAFSDIQYRFANDTKDGIMVRLGVRLNLF